MGIASYTWDTAGRLVVRELAGAVTTYGWGATNGLLEGVSVDVDGIADSDVAFTYDASGQRATETFDGGQRTWVRTNGRVTGYQETLEGTLVRDATIGWNGAGQIATVSDAVASTTWNLGWDPAGQLTSIDDGTTTRALTYTDLGQRATDTATGVYTYDSAGQLVERIAPDTSVHTYGYDPDGRRSTETIDDVLAATYTWDTAGRLVEIDRGATSTTLGHSSAGWLDTISHDDGTSIDTWNVTFDAHDPAVGLAAVTDPDDTTAWSVGTGGRTSTQLTAGGVGPVSRDLFDTPTTPGDLDPFGDTTTTGVVAAAIGYRSELTTDRLVYLRHRHYDPTTAQFLTKDPLDGVPSTPTITNPYHHTDNNPITKTDPTGLRPGDDEFGGGSSVTGSAPITPRPGYGKLRVNLFISACESGYLSMQFHGDCRDFDRFAGDDDSRATFTVDFERGIVRVFVNDSCRVGGDCHDALPLGVNHPGVGDACGTPEAPPVIAECRNALSEAYPPNVVEVTDAGTTVRIGYRLVNSAAPWYLPTPAIDGTLRITPISTSNEVRACFDGDDYPSMEIYQDVGASTRILARWSESRIGPGALAPPAVNRKECAP